MKRKLLIALIAITATLCGALSFAACGDSDSGNHSTINLIYELNEDKQSYRVIGMEDTTATDIILASEYNGLPVTSIGEEAFCCCISLTSVSIPDGITSIGDRAFDSCSSLTRITISNSVTSIGEEVFYGCDSLTSITIPDGVTSIGNWSFEHCNSLKSITIPHNLTSIGSCAFNQCSSLTDIKFSGTKEQWNAIKKDYGWNDNTGDYTIHCTDGDIAK